MADEQDKRTYHYNNCSGIIEGRQVFGPKCGKKPDYFDVEN